MFTFSVEHLDEEVWPISHCIACSYNSLKECMRAGQSFENVIKHELESPSNTHTHTRS